MPYREEYISLRGLIGPLMYVELGYTSQDPLKRSDVSTCKTDVTWTITGLDDLVDWVNSFS